MRTAGLTTAYVGVGANLGDRAATIAAAIDEIGDTPGVAVIRQSNLIETEAVGGPDASPPFLNGAIEVSTSLGSHAFMARLIEIEEKLGRERREKWEPRIIDLDLLLFGDRIISSDNLIVPHPLMQERKFVLAPLAEIAPDFVHPALQMTIAGLLQNVDGKLKAE